jgi:tetratricopeptide (TPR) repeat protein
VLGATFIPQAEPDRIAAEFHRALDLNRSADVLTFYAPAAALFGEAAAGAAAADRAIKLNPNLPLWANECYRDAYFWVGRYDDAVRFGQRLPEASRGFFDHLMLAASLGGLGRKDEAAVETAKLLALDPDYSIEEEVAWPGYDAALRSRMIEAMRAAAFPVCAGAERLAMIPPGKRLPACSPKPTVD